MGTVWILDTDSKYIVRGLKGKVGSFHYKPTIKQIRNLFKHRKKGTIYYELWERTKEKGKYMFDSRLRVNRWRTEYKLIKREELSIL